MIDSVVTRIYCYVLLTPILMFDQSDKKERRQSIAKNENQMKIFVVIVAVDNSLQHSVESEEQSHEKSECSAVTLSNVSSDSSSVPHLLRSKSSNCFQKTSSSGVVESERRFFLPSIDRTGSVSAQHRPATSGDVRLNNERQVNTDDVHRSQRPSAVTVWNSLTSVSPNSLPADPTLQLVTRSSFLPSPPPRKHSNSNN